MCRGVSAKRSSNVNKEELRDLGDLDDTWMDWPRSSPEEFSDSSLGNRRGSNRILRELLEKFHDYASLRDEDN
ncbi:hypothetical protein X975_13357, partial [Stegodyphus mimosarum]